MKEIRSIHELIRRPVILGPVAAALGGGAAVCILGIPELWSSEAAGWASAVGTTAAAGVALYVGLAPERARRSAAYRRAWAVMQWAEGALGTQLVHLGHAIELMRPDLVYAEERRKLCSELDILDAGPVRMLVDYFDALDADTIRSAGRCVIDMERAIQTARNIKNVQEKSVLDMDGIRDIFFDVYMSMDDTRMDFARLIYGAVERYPEPIEVTKARAVAAARK